MLARAGLLSQLAASARLGALPQRCFASKAEGNVFVIFGAGGVGQELAKRLVAGNSKVFLADKDVSDVKLEGAETKEIDALNSKEVVDFLQSVADDQGKLTGVTSLIGSMAIKPAHTTSDDELHSALQTNTVTAFNVVRGATKAMMANKLSGSIVLASASIAHTGVPNHDAIATAKGAVGGLTLGAAATYAEHKIRVNCVAPGLTKTGMTERIWKNDAHLAESEKLHPMGRVGEPKDIARAVEFFLDPENDFITGQILGVDGGMIGAS